MQASVERSQPVQPLKDFRCRRCGSVVGDRRGNTLLYAGLEIDFKRSQDMVCPHCKEMVRFYVDTQRQSSAKLG